MLTTCIPDRCPTHSQKARRTEVLTIRPVAHIQYGILRHACVAWKSGPSGRRRSPSRGSCQRHPRRRRRRRRRLELTACDFIPQKCRTSPSGHHLIVFLTTPSSQHNRVLKYQSRLFFVLYRLKFVLSFVHSSQSYIRFIHTLSIIFASCPQSRSSWSRSRVFVSFS